MHAALTSRESLQQRVSNLSAEQREVLRKLQTSRLRSAPLSAAQRRLWFLDRLTPNSPSYNIDLAFRLELEPESPIDLEAMAAALNHIIERHEPLRSTFSAVDGDPVQLIHPAFSLPLPLIDLSGLAEAERQNELMRRATEEAQLPFDLTKLPLLRATLLRLDTHSFVFLLTLHHIVADGWSLQIFSSEFTQLYDAFRLGRPSPLPALPSHFSEYAERQRAWLRSAEAEQQLAYWKRLLHQAPTLALPTDRPRAALPSFRGARQMVLISQSLTRRLEALCRRESTTLFATLLAAFQTLLHRYTGQSEIVLGTPVLGRGRADTENLIGCFINTVVMRTELAGDPSFRTALQRTSETVVQALQNQELPFEKIVEELNVPRDLSRNPLFQVAFQLFQTNHRGSRETRPVLTQKGTTQLDLAIDLFQSNEGLSGTIEYSTDLFDDSTIERLVGHFRVLLEGVVENPDQRLSQLPLLTHSERRQLLTEWSAAFPFESRTESMAALIDRQCRQRPDSVAIYAETRSMRYDELQTESDRFAAYLQSLELSEGALVALSVDRSPEAVVALIGSFKAGCAVLMLDAHVPADRRSFMLSDAKPAVVFTNEDLGAKWPTILATETKLRPIQPSPDSCAYIIYTSGSSGAPKGVVISHRALSNHMLWWHDAFPLNPSERMLHKYSLGFDVSLVEIFAPLMAGAASVIARPGAQADSVYLAELIAAHQIAAIDVVPTQLRALLDEPLFLACQSLRRIACGGEPLPRDLAESCLAAFPRAELANFYGPTETAISVTGWKCTPTELARGVAIGKPIRNTEVYVLDPAGNPVPIGIAGELHIGGDGLAKGYLNRPDLTAEKFIAHPFSSQPGARLYRTGDLVRFRSDGNLEHLGRIDDQVKVRGFRIELGEIEAVLATAPGVQACVVAPSTSGSLTAYVVPEQHSEIWPSVGEYGIYDPLLYYAMTHDERRNAAYRTAIAQLVPGKTVVDVGTGADALLARFCIEAGATRVYAIERLPESFERATRLIAELQLGDRIQLFLGDATTVKLPEPVDVCVSELLGMISSSEGAAVILNDARRFLKPGGSMIPHRSSTRVAAVTLPDALAENPRFTEISGPYVERIFAQMGGPFDLRVCIDRFPRSHLLTESAEFEAQDFKSYVSPSFQSEIALKTTKAGRLDGFLLWLQFETIPGEVLDVLAERTHWLPVFFPLPSSLFVGADTVITATAAGVLSKDNLHPDYRIVGAIHQQTGPVAFHLESNRETREFRSSRFYQNLLSDGYTERYVRPSGKVEIKQLEDHLRRALPEYMIPSAFVSLTDLPLLASGKVDRRKLPAPGLARTARPPIPPRTELERSIAAVWKDLLRIDSAGVDDNFFELGGHSLLAVQMISRLRKQLNLTVTLVGVFQFPTIRLLANSLNKGGASL